MTAIRELDFNLDDDSSAQLQDLYYRISFRRSSIDEDVPREEH
jgi:hypothetical protein